MLIQKLHLENFLSFGDTLFEVGPTGVLLVSGLNGSGKSSLTSKAITWALYGETPGGVKGDDVSSMQAPKAKTRVKLWLQVHGRPWVIERTRNPGRLVVTDTEAGKEINFRNMRETQDFINQLVGRDINGFLAADYFGQDSQKRFLQCNPTAQQAVVEGILKLDERVEPLIEEGKTRSSLLTAQIRELDSKIQQLQGQQGQLQNSISASQERHEALQNELTRLQQTTIPAPKLPEAPVSPQMVEPLVQVSPLPDLPATDPATISSQIETFSSQLTELKQRKQEINDQLSAAREDKNSVQLEANRLASEISVRRGQVRQVTPEQCPECGQRVNAEVTDNLLTEQRQIEEAISVLIAQNDEVGQKLQAIEAQISAELSPALAEVRAQEVAIDAEIMQRQTMIRKFYEAKAAYDAVVEKNNAAEAVAKRKADETNARLVREYEAAKQAHETQVQQITLNYQKSVTELASSIAAKEATIREIVRAVAENTEALERAQIQALQLEAEKTETAKNLALADQWVGIFRHSFKRFILQRCLEFLNNRTAHHLALLGNSQIEVEFSNTKTLKSGEEKGSFQAVAKTTMGGQAYSHLSGGERQMASFAVGLALSELADAQSGTSSEFLILDEPFTELDPKNCASVIQHVNEELLKYKQSVILISNDPHLRQLVANRVEVTKDVAGVSTLNVG